MNQKDYATQAMIEWLTVDLQKPPHRVELTKSFDYDDMTYYIFKFKKNFFEIKWMLAVCGGYETGSNEHCGHIFSDFKEYKQESEQEEAIQIVEKIKDYWKSQAESIS